MSEPTNREPLTININREVQVTLTDHGRQMLRDYYATLGMEVPAGKLKPGPLTFPLHGVMNIFGDYLFMGATKLPFEGNNIVLLPDADAIRMEEIDARMKEIEGS